VHAREDNFSARSAEFLRLFDDLLGLSRSAAAPGVRGCAERAMLVTSILYLQPRTTPAHEGAKHGIENV
jgi:hypothetical protein